MIPRVGDLFRRYRVLEKAGEGGSVATQQLEEKTWFCEGGKWRGLPTTKNSSLLLIDREGMHKTASLNLIQIANSPPGRICHVIQVLYPNQA